MTPDRIGKALELLKNFPDNDLARVNLAQAYVDANDFKNAAEHLQPLCLTKSDWVFRSPLSYWDRHHYGQIVGPVEIAACIALSVLLWRRFRGWPARALILLGLMLEAAPAIMFALMFANA